jgi:hypothetical protein
MKFLLAAGGELIGLFVGDWLQSGVVVVILAIGWYAVSKLGGWALIPLVLLLAAQLVWFARAEALRPKN